MWGWRKARETVQKECRSCRTEGSPVGGWAHAGLRRGGWRGPPFLRTRIAGAHIEAECTSVGMPLERRGDTAMDRESERARERARKRESERGGWEGGCERCRRKYREASWAEQRIERGMRYATADSRECELAGVTRRPSLASRLSSARAYRHAGHHTRLCHCQAYCSGHGCDDSVTSVPRTRSMTTGQQSSNVSSPRSRRSSK